ncbi:hypothetical protein IS513_06140 [Proteus mirabilis]|uniref:hypothetical protein n=1 Tax=Proteus mirabilis TaxID=584 RepID=UPI001ADBADF1|nr:hypothetical protein [Proteus mirabilis]MBO8263372.1 hypothetical protein [Proteus mirabilis]MBO8266686.1 hypothetical protein [Proteus mirabilis]MBO8274663.1 hypothetical protein [Proteus mirabilis]MBO8278315.1 hypothetical protein [Proteus mirabilis]MBO8281844.1 hypothetical protein [Proteus mirabilis]
MNKNELQVLIDYTKGMIADNKEPEKKVIIALCDELERITELEPVAWMYPVFHDEKMQFTTDAVASENIDIHFQSHGSPFKVTPLYKLD